MISKLSKIFPNGCSDKQLDDLRLSWFDKYGNPFTSGKLWPKAIQKLDSQISALGMLSSCFAYHGLDYFFNGSGIMYKESHYEHYLKEYLGVGGTKEEYDTMLDIQKKYLSKCSVNVDVHTDSEGCSYNSINFI